MELFRLLWKAVKASHKATLKTFVKSEWFPPLALMADRFKQRPSSLLGITSTEAAALDLDMAAFYWLLNNKPDPLLEIRALLKGFMGVTDDGTE